MSGSRRHNILISIYQDYRTVFRLNDISLITGQSDFISLNQRLNYYARTGRLLNPRKGIYAKPSYKPEELACILYTPSYISLEYVLQRSGMIFQYEETITTVSYLSRVIEMENNLIRYRKIKGEVLVNMAGINRREDHVNMATAERAFLDLIYLEKEVFIDNPGPLNKKSVYDLLKIYQSGTMTNRVKKILEDD